MSSAIRIYNFLQTREENLTGEEPEPSLAAIIGHKNIQSGRVGALAESQDRLSKRNDL